MATVVPGTPITVALNDSRTLRVWTNTASILREDYLSNLSSATLKTLYYGPGPFRHTVGGVTGGGNVTLTCVQGSIEYALGEAGAQNTARVDASRALNITDSGMTLECTTTLTLTVPAGLPPSFGVDVIPSGTTSIASSGTPLLNGATTTVTRTAASNQLFKIVPRASVVDSYVVTGT